MALKDNDTDPSTPGAMRTPDSRAAATGTDTHPMPKARSKFDTDPGVGPPSGERAKPMGVVVPSAKGGRHDSVDLLLDGITGPQPERTKMTPQSAGQASAAYHAEHPVRPAHTSPDDMPKVVVDRPAQIRATSRHERQPIKMPVSRPRAPTEPTVVHPPAMGPRVVVAVAAGLVVVMALFLVLKMTAGKPVGGVEPATGTAVATTTMAGKTPATAETGLATAAPAATPTPAAAATDIASESAAMVAAPPAATVAEPGSAHAHPHPAASGHVKPKPAPSATGSDLGEFKTTF